MYAYEREEVIIDTDIAIQLHGFLHTKFLKIYTLHPA